MKPATEKALRDRISELEEYIKDDGETFDHCTFNILHRLCDGCRCNRRKKKPASVRQATEGAKGLDPGAGVP